MIIFFYSIVAILIYLMMSTMYGFFVYFFEKNSEVKYAKQSDKIGKITDWLFNHLNIDKYPVLTGLVMIIFAIIFSGQTARFIKDGSWLGGHGGIEEDIELNAGEEKC